MKNIRILTAGALTLCASTSMAATVSGPTSDSADPSISTEEGYELFTLDDDYTVINSNRFLSPVQKPLNTATYRTIPIGEDGARDTGVAAIPVPAAVWLFGSGLIGLVVVARRRS